LKIQHARLSRGPLQAKTIPYSTRMESRGSARNLFCRALCLAVLLIVPWHNVCLGCTVFVCSTQDGILFGNSEDGPVGTPYLWTAPPTESTFGAVFYGFANGVAQGGMNDQGLCFDATAIPAPGARWMRGAWPSTHPLDFCQAALRECGSVAELRVFLESHVLARIAGGQFLFADRQGGVLFLGISAHGRIVIIDSDQAPRVLTNFNALAPELGGHPCERHSAAQSIMRSVAQGALPLDRETFVGTLRQVHIDEGASETVYASVLEPREALVHLYFAHDLDTAVTLDVRKFSSQMSLIPMGDLFP